MIQNDFPKVSIITVSYNAANQLTNAIESVLNQTYPAIEYIIVDGASTDNTRELLQTYQRAGKLKYISEPDNGIFDAMNKGVNLSTGEWIFFLGSDDVFFDNEVVEKIFSNGPHKEEIIYGNVKFLHSGIIYDGSFDHEKISIKNICHQALFVKKSVFDRIGLFNTKYKMSADYEFNIRWMGLNMSSLYVDKIVVIYNEKGMSGLIWDQAFDNDFEQILIENNIVSQRSFASLKRMHNSLRKSFKYKVGYFIITPLSWLKNKLSFK